MARAAGSSEVEPVGLGSAVALIALVAATPVWAALLHPVIAYPVAALALATLIYRQRQALAVFACLAAGALAALANQSWLQVVVFRLDGVPLTARAPVVMGVLTACSLLLVGPATAALMRRRPALETTALVAAALTAAHVVALAVLADGADMSLQAYMAGAIAGMVAPFGGLAEVEKLIVESWPSLVATLNGFTAVLVVVGVGLVALRSKAEVFRFPAVASIDLSPWVVVPGIIGIALLAAGRLQVDIASALGAIGRNLLVVVRWVFFLQGIAVFAALYQRAKYGRLTRSLGYVLLGITEQLVPLVSLTGLADIWLNIRRLPREKRSDEVVEAPSDTD